MKTIFKTLVFILLLIGNSYLLVAQTEKKPAKKTTQDNPSVNYGPLPTLDKADGNTSTKANNNNQTQPVVYEKLPADVKTTNGNNGYGQIPPAAKNANKRNIIGKLPSPPQGTTNNNSAYGQIPPAAKNAIIGKLPSPPQGTTNNNGAYDQVPPAAKNANEQNNSNPKSIYAPLPPLPNKELIQAKKANSEMLLLENDKKSLNNKIQDEKKEAAAIYKNKIDAIDAKNEQKKAEIIRSQDAKKKNSKKLDKLTKKIDKKTSKLLDKQDKKALKEKKKLDKEYVKDLKSIDKKGKSETKKLKKAQKKTIKEVIKSNKKELKKIKKEAKKKAKSTKRPRGRRR